MEIFFAYTFNFENYGEPTQCRTQCEIFSKYNQLVGAPTQCINLLENLLEEEPYGEPSRSRTLRRTFSVKNPIGPIKLLNAEPYGVPLHSTVKCAATVVP